MSEEIKHHGLLEVEGRKILDGIQDVELDPMEVDKLFKVEHPLQMTQNQRAVVVEALRRSRKNYQLKKKAKKTKAKKEKPVVDIAGFSLEDLDIKAEDILKL